MDQSRLRAPDPYGRTFQMDEQALAAIAARLEARGKHPFFGRVIDDYMDALSLAGPEAILDLGCGTGVAARAIARRPDAKGAITAVDISAHLLDMARRLTREEGLAGRIDFRTGDAHGLGLPWGGFDVIVMHTLVSHVADPATVLAEGRRLLRPGGRLVVFDGDYASLTMATDAPDGGAETDRVLHGALFSQLRVMRAMPRLLAEGGFGLQWSRAYVAATSAGPSSGRPRSPPCACCCPGRAPCPRPRPRRSPTRWSAPRRRAAFSPRATSIPTWPGAVASSRGRRCGLAATLSETSLPVVGAPTLAA